MASQQQPMFQGQQNGQPQNAGQQKQMPNAQQKATTGAQSTQEKYDPQLTFWSLEKTKGVESWADVKPQQQHISLAELQDELERFKRKDLTAKKILDELKSPNCRRQINSLADDQTKVLQKTNKTLKYILGGILPEWRYIDRRKREKVLGRVQVILQTVPSGLTEVKPAAGAGNAAGAQNAKQAGQNPVGQQQKNNAQQGQPHMGQSQHFDQRPPPNAGGGHQGGHAPPPPPPPPGMHGGPEAHFPPPPPMAGPGGMHEPRHPHMNDMPGAFPESRGQPPFDPRFMHAHKSKQKVHRGSYSDASSSDWDTETTGTSNSGSFDAYSVDNGYNDVRRGHGKHSKRGIHVKKAHRRVQSRSRSRGPTKGHRTPTGRRRDSDSSNSRSGRRSPRLSSSRSPYHSSGDESKHGHRKKHKHRSRSRESLTRSYNKKAFERASSSPMSRTDSQGSWSDASSSSRSSGHERRDRDSDRERGRGRGHRRTHSHSRRYHGEPDSSRYDIPKPRFDPRDGLADDYPHETTRGREYDTYRDPLFTHTRPIPPRRAATGIPEPNPFFVAADLPPRQARAPAYEYAANIPERDYEYVPRPSAYMPGNSPTGNGRYTEDDIRRFRDHANQGRRHVPLRRAQTMEPGYFERADTQHVPLRRQYPDQRERGYFDDEAVHVRYASRVPVYETADYRR